MRTIGFFGGTFDPIHFGHINLALQLLEIHRLDEVLFCPAFLSPLKSAAPPVATPEQRLAMLRLALEGIPHFRISTAEFDRKGPSYTIDTLRQLSHQEKAKFCLLLSEEAAVHFDAWKEPQELLRLAPPLVGMRSLQLPLSGPYAEALKKGFTPTKIMEISSREIRARLKKGLPCVHLVPAKALDYISRNHLYFS